LVYHLFGRLCELDSLVLTEDDYFDYLIGVTSNKDLIPGVVRRALADTALLFLGFRLEEWNFRVLFRSIMSQEGGGRRARYAHVAAQLDPEEGRILEPERARKYLESYFHDSRISIYWGNVEDFAKELLLRSQGAKA
jgi:SIR2-like domain